MRFSIIIALKEDNPFLRECLAKIAKLAYLDHEVLILPDAELSVKQEGVRIIPTGPCLPAKKRDLGAEHASGEILAFLDDDAYPSEGWLTHAAKDFQDPGVGAVGGPAVTPPTEEFMRRASGYVYASRLVSGNFRYRYVRASRRFCDDYPSCNLMVRKDLFMQIGGFKTNFWPGEDTFLCLEITKKLCKKIVYDPDVLVFHHRRALFLPHLRQISSYGLHRGYFAKRFPETSLRWQYFVPSTFLLWLIFGLTASIFNRFFLAGYLSLLFVYAFLVVLSSRQEHDSKMSHVVFLGIFLSHLTYGFYFLIGLMIPRLKEEKTA